MSSWCFLEYKKVYFTLLVLSCDSGLRIRKLHVYISISLDRNGNCSPCFMSSTLKTNHYTTLQQPCKQRWNNSCYYQTSSGEVYWTFTSSYNISKATGLNGCYRCMRALREHQRTRSPPPPALQYGWKKATAGPPSWARRALRRLCSHRRIPSRSSRRTRVRSRLRYAHGTTRDHSSLQGQETVRWQVE